MKKYTILLISLLSINLVIAQQTEVKTDFEVGTLPGSLGINPSGAATYTIPIDLPEGRVGITPQLAFVYNSHTEGNIMGKGWGIAGFSSISRTNPTIYYNGEIDNVDFEDDQYMLDGQRLIYVGDAKDGVEYRTEVDNAQKVIYYINEDKPFFKVYLKNGTVKEYGKDDSRQYYGEDDNTPLAWHLKRIIDVKGNKIEYSYFRNASIGEIHPITIEYTNYEGNNTTKNENYSVNFSYDAAFLNANQYLISYIEKETTNGTYDKYINENTNLLLSISIKHNGHPLKKYTLSYFSEMSSTKDVFLKDITLDFNGDGKTDICQLNMNGNNGFTKKTYFSFGSGFVVDENEEPLPAFLDPDYGYPIAIDLNNDGRSDFVYIGLGGTGYITQAYYTMKKGINQAESEMQEIGISPDIEGIAAFTFADITGNGIMDYAVEFWEKEIIIQNDIKDDKVEVEIIFYLYNFIDKQCGESNLRTIQNGFGTVSKINYQRYGKSYSNSTPVYTYPLSKYKSKKYIVTETYLEDGSNKLNHFQFSFVNPVMHKEGKGFLGFDYITKTNITTGTNTITEFNIFDDGIGKYFQIYPKLTIIKNLTDNILKTTENEFDIKIITNTQNDLAFYPFIHKCTGKT